MHSSAAGGDPGTLTGAWVPVAASLAGQDLLVSELRVRYLMLGGHDYRIIDRTNQVVDRGEYQVNDHVSPATLDIVGRSGPNAGHSMLAIYELDGDRLVVCYDLDSRERPHQLRVEGDRLLLSITYERAPGVLS